MHLYELLAVLIYLIALIAVGVLSYKKQLTESDFIIGGRSMGSWLTAMAAQASDMSSWLFMAYPSFIFLEGPVRIWTGVGLFVFMFLNWHFVAPKIRVATEEYNCMTFSSFFENRVADTSGWIRIFTAVMSLVFYTIYISAGLVGMAYLIEMLFGVPYQISVIIGIVVIIPYVFIGGFRTLAWVDLFQGLFLLIVILLVPLYLLPRVGGFAGIEYSYHLKRLSYSLIPDFSAHSLQYIVILIAGWGLGYFGQPHIVTKFMGIKRVSEIPRAKFIGMSWMFVALGAASLVGLVGSPSFQGGIANPELIFITMVRNAFHPFIIGFIFCAIIAATINANGSQILVLASTLSEDIYKRIFRKTATSKELLLVSRCAVILVALIAYCIAAFSNQTIYGLVLYAWSGLGSAFGPLLLFSLYSKRLNRYAAWAGILSGGIIAAFWPLVEKAFDFNLFQLIPGFIISSLFIIIFSRIHKPQKTKHET